MASVGFETSAGRRLMRPLCDECCWRKWVARVNVKRRRDLEQQTLTVSAQYLLRLDAEDHKSRRRGQAYE